MQKSKKKIHKQIISFMRKANKGLLEDEYIGCGRFRIDLWSEQWCKYSDGSGYYINLLFKMTDTLTNNKAFFYCDNYDYKYKIYWYLNDFLIRCSSGNKGHYPPLRYVAYDIHKIVPYKENEKQIEKVEDYVIETYSWIDKIKFERGNYE